MSRNSAADAHAFSKSPMRSQVWISPDGQPVVAMMPFAYRLSSSRSARGL
jgi:hypothetical protein